MQIAKELISKDFGAHLLSFEEQIRFVGGIDPDDLFIHVGLESPLGELDRRAFWAREKINKNIFKVHEGVASGYLTAFGADGRIAAPGEDLTIQLWLDARRVSTDALCCAILLTFLRSSEWSYSSRQSQAAREIFSQLKNDCHAFLRKSQVDSHTSSRTWFLPERFELDQDVDSPVELVETLGRLAAGFLQKWVPVVLKVELELTR